MRVLCTYISANGLVLGFYDMPDAEQCEAMVSTLYVPAGDSYAYTIAAPSVEGVQQSIDSGSGSTSLPSAEDAATAWGIGFVLVVGCYVIARSVGAVVNFINEK